MIQLANKATCTGCMACVAACPKKAIASRRDDLGNLYPDIQETLCIECGRCQKACPALHPIPPKSASKAYAVWSLDPKNRKTSTSGGAAAVFYEKALEKGYSICGAQYASDCTVIHTVSDDKESISRYKQSKYVYSHALDAYTQIKARLEQGKKVVIISLPCKIAGLKGYLGKDYENLLTVDIVCHGTPSDQMLKEHIQSVVPKAEDLRVRFRQDNAYMLQLSREDTVLYRKMGRTDTYLAAFLEGISYRESCYSCEYARPQRVSDITICDFWGLGAEIPFEHPYTGSISAVLIHSERGQAFFDDCTELLFVEERPVSEAVKGNAQLNIPAPKHSKRQQFEQLYQEKGFETAVRTVLHHAMKAERKKLARQRLRDVARGLAGVIIKRYRRQQL